MNSFIVSIGLTTPFIPGRRLNLDGLLSGLIYERTQDVARAIEEVPLARQNGIYEGSSAFVTTPFHADPLTVSGGVRVQVLDPDLVQNKIRAKSGQKRWPRIDTQRGDYQSFVNEYVTIATPYVHFIGTGDMDAVRALFDDVAFIGKKRSSGFGQTVSIDVTPFEAQAAHPAFVLPDGTPARPLPLALFQGLSNGDFVDGYERARPPYIDGEPERCALPVHVGFGLEDMAARLTGAEL